MTNNKLLTIDAHAHAGACGASRPDQLLPPAHDLLACMDAAGVDMAVLHTNDIWGMEYAARMLREHGDRFIGVCKVDGAHAHTPRGLQAIEHHVAAEGFRGLYFDPWPPTLDAYSNFHAPTYRPLWDLVDAMQLPICFVSYGTRSPDLFPNLVKLLDQYPELIITIVHGLYLRNAAPPDLFDNHGGVNIDKEIIDLVNGFDVSLEILAGYPGAWFGPNDILIKALYDTFGPRKLYWGSEFTKAMALSPEDARSARHYARQFNYLREHCPYISKPDLDWILGGNTARIHGLDPVVTATKS